MFEKILEIIEAIHKETFEQGIVYEFDYPNYIWRQSRIGVKLNAQFRREQGIDNVEEVPDSKLFETYQHKAQYVLNLLQMAGGFVFVGDKEVVCGLSIPIINVLILTDKEEKLKELVSSLSVSSSPSSSIEFIDLLQE